MRRRRFRMAALLCAGLILFLVLNSHLQPLIASYGLTQAKLVGTQAVNDAVTAVLEREGVRYTDLMRVEKDSQGSIVSVEADTVKINALKATLDSQKITVSVIQANQGKINVMHSYHSLGRVLRDAGFRFPPLIESIPEGGRMDVSAERLPELDADFVFATWRGDTGGKPQDELAAMEKVMPGWCQFLTACRSGRYVLISREEAISNSFASLGLMAAQIQSQIAGRPLPEAK